MVAIVIISSSARLYQCTDTFDIFLLQYQSYTVGHVTHVIDKQTIYYTTLYYNVSRDI